MNISDNRILWNYNIPNNSYHKYCKNIYSQNGEDGIIIQLLKELNNTRISCKNVDFKFFGFSLATINTFISLIFSIITFRIFINYEKK